jgi:hypothetical protein
MSKLQIQMIVLAGLAALALAPGARADEWNQKTVVTFAAPVEIPGQVWPAGTYVFKLANSQSSRQIVQVFNKNENHLFATFLAIPSYRHRPSEKTIIRFEERAAGSPQALKAWFYPNKNHGHEFVYPKTEALELAKANNLPVPSMPGEFALTTTMPAVTLHAPEVVALTRVPLKEEEPNGEEVELAQASVTPSRLPDTLPETASSLPLLGLIGLLSLGTAASLRVVAARVK